MYRDLVLACAYIYDFGALSCIASLLSLERNLCAYLQVKRGCEELLLPSLSWLSAFTYILSQHFIFCYCFPFPFSVLQCHFLRKVRKPHASPYHEPLPLLRGTIWVSYGSIAASTAPSSQVCALTSFHSLSLLKNVCIVVIRQHKRKRESTLFYLYFVCYFSHTIPILGKGSLEVFSLSLSLQIVNLAFALLAYHI